MTDLFTSAAMAASALLLQPPPVIVTPNAAAAAQPALPFETGWLRISHSGRGGSACSATGSGPGFVRLAARMCAASKGSDSSAGGALFELDLMIEIAREGAELPRIPPAGRVLVQVADVAATRSGHIAECRALATEGVAIPDLCDELRVGSAAPFEATAAPGLRRGRVRVTTKTSFR